MSFYEKLEQNRKYLNDNEEEILSYLLKQNEQLSDLTIREASNHFYTSPNTIIRLTQKLDFSGFQQFKEEFLTALKLQKSLGELYSLDDMIIKTKQLINTETINRIVQSIHEADNILFFAVGLSRFPAEEFSERLKLVGKQSQTFIDPHIMKHNAQLMKVNDLAIAISVSGRQRSNAYAAVSRAKIAGAKTLSITGFSSNPLANLTDLQLYGFSSPLKINELDATDRFSIHYLTNYLFDEYIKQYHHLDTTTS